MKRFGWLAALVLAWGSLVGCSGSTGSSTAGSADGAGTPDQAVQTFLDAVRQGNDQEAGKMLTSLAQQRTAEMEMVVAPPGSDTASFEVGKVEEVEADAAHVDSTWTDLDHEGKPRTDMITWILRREEGSWRIAGMATKIFQDQEPVVLNFEDPQDMLDKQRAAEQEAMRRANDQSQQARQPSDPFPEGRQ